MTTKTLEKCDKCMRDAGIVCIISLIPLAVIYLTPNPNFDAFYSGSSTLLERLVFWAHNLAAVAFMFFWLIGIDINAKSRTCTIHEHSSKYSANEDSANQAKA